MPRKSNNQNAQADTATEATTNEVNPTEQQELPNPVLSSGFIFGAILVSLGALFLLHNLGFIQVEFRNVISLWPLALIAIGISLLTFKSVFSRSIALIVLGLLLGVMVLAALGFIRPDSRVSSTVESQEVSIQQEVETENPAIVRVKAGAGKIEINSDDFDSLVQAHLESNFAKLRQSTSIKDNQQEVVIETEGSTQWWSRNYTNNLFVTLNESSPLHLALDAGAADISLDLADMLLERLDIDSGASDLEVRLGERVDMLDVVIDIGMSSATFTVPEDSGVRLEVDSGLSNVEVEGLRRVNSGVYESEEYSLAEHKIVIKGNMGMSNFELERY